MVYLYNESMFRPSQEPKYTFFECIFYLRLVNLLEVSMVQRQQEVPLQMYQTNNYLFFLNQFGYRLFHPILNNIHHFIFLIRFQINLISMIYITFNCFN